MAFHGIRLRATGSQALLARRFGDGHFPMYSGFASSSGALMEDAGSRTDRRNMSQGDWRNLPDPDPTIAPRLIEWFDNNGRSFPWRRPISAYHLLSVELMLQRTHADQVRPVFEGFCEKFASPRDVLSAGRGVVDAMFRRLGLLWRAEMFWKLQIALVQDHAGEIPRSDRELRSLPGVGDYVATAVRVFAFGERLTVLDSNVLRILGRYFGITFPDHARRSRRVRSWADRLAPEDPDACRRYNWALIDLGALICTPRTPRHFSCPIRVGCRLASEPGGPLSNGTSWGQGAAYGKGFSEES